jgi:LysR family transcriptional activator of nhaA
MNELKALSGEALLHPELAALVHTVRLGTVSAAARALGVSQPALSSRLSRLGKVTGGALFARDGRKLRLTAHGARVHDGALRVARGCDALVALLRGTPGPTMPLRVGTSDAVPKLVVRKILAPYIRAGMRLQCIEWAGEHLEREIRAHRIDLLITDREPVGLRGQELVSRVAGRSRVCWCARPDLARTLRRDYPRSLGEAALALPAESSPLRERIERWLQRNAPRARVVVEAEDRALLHHFAQAYRMAIPVARTTAQAVERQFGLVRVGDLAGVEESYYVVRSRWRVPDGS